MQMFFVCRLYRFLPQLVNGVEKTKLNIPMQRIKFNSIRSLCSKSEDKSVTQDMKKSNNKIIWKQIYVMPKISVARTFHRLKFYQSIFTICVLPVTVGFYCAGKTDITTVLVVTGVASFTCLSMYALTSFFKRLVGIVFIDQDKKHLKISHLTFWGKRKDITVAVDEIMPLTDCDNNPYDAFVKLQRTNSDEVLYMTLRFGKILDDNIFQQVFGRLEILSTKK